MAMTVRNFLELPITKEFTVLTGHTYLQRTMKNVEILDFEFLQGFENTRETMFTEGSLVLSSLLFAKNDAQLLLHMVEELVKCKVSAFAFKAVIYEQLPQEVLALAEEKKLPILRFGGDEFFEDIIFQAMDFRNKLTHNEFLLTKITYLLEERLTPEQLPPLLKQLNKPFEENVQIICVKGNQQQLNDLFRFEPFLRTGLICQYKGRILVALTNASKDYDFQARWKELLTLFTIEEKNTYIGESEILQTTTHFHLALQQAYYTSIFAEIYAKPHYSYTKLATEKLLIQLVRDQASFITTYIDEYIVPIQSEQQLLETAIDFILAEGNIKAVADKQFCHANTIRYRLNKIKLLTNVSGSDWLFYEQLAIAIKLYLLLQKIEEDESL